MAKVITVINQKGGVGKSTTCESIGAFFRDQGKKVLFIDLDPQCNLSYLLGAQSDETIWEYFCAKKNNAEVSLKNFIQTTDRGDVIGSSQFLAHADSSLLEMGREYYLKEGIEELEGTYDYIVIDTPPSLGIVSINALTATNGIVIPTQADILSLQGIGQLIQTVTSVRKYSNPSLQIYGLLLVRYNARTNISKGVADYLATVANDMGTTLFDTKIRECTAIKEAQINKNSIYDYDKKSNAAKDYNSFVRELEARLG